MAKKEKKEPTPIIPVYFEPEFGDRVAVGSADIRDGEITLSLFNREEVEKNNER